MSACHQDVTHRIQSRHEAGEASIVLQADVGVIVQGVLLPVVLKVVPRLWVLHTYRLSAAVQEQAAPCMHGLGQALSQHADAATHQAWPTRISSTARLCKTP